MLRIARDLSLPDDTITKTLAILAKRRVGKTYAGSVIAEEMVRQGLPFYVLDPTGAWWGLRAAANGKDAGYPVIVIGGEHGDVPIDHTAGVSATSSSFSNNLSALRSLGLVGYPKQGLIVAESILFLGEA